MSIDPDLLNQLFPPMPYMDDNEAEALPQTEAPLINHSQEEAAHHGLPATDGPASLSPEQLIAGRLCIFANFLDQLARVVQVPDLYLRSSLVQSCIAQIPLLIDTLSTLRDQK
jgi:hypothetical protein